MWICSKLGFFSIVQKSADWHIRARVRADLTNLAAAAGIEPDIIETRSADYRFRILADQAALRQIFKALCSSINYPNFKSKIAASKDQRAKLHAYGSFWSGMASMQEMARRSEDHRSSPGSPHE